ncbi:Patched domain-containing protein 3 [Armadillidium vulgare]|nr:Patched domain-containing protein 3 [Armadillidium vulgare]
MMLALRKVAKEAPFNVITYHPLFVFFDQFVLVTPLTIQTICLVAVIMMLVSLVFIPNPFCCLWIFFSIVSIEMGVLGYMSLWDVSLDCISMINLIMCIGFSVDFSAHISYSYLTAKGESPDQRVKDCLYSLGLPVIQSGLSTIAGIIVFVVAPSNIYRTFLKIISLVIIFGIMHALLLLPVMLSLLGPGSCQSKKKKLNLNLTFNNISKIEKDYSDPPTIRIIQSSVKSQRDKISQSSGSTCSEINESDTESTRASSRSRRSLEREENTKAVNKSQNYSEEGGRINPAFERDLVGDGKDNIHGSTYL